MAQIIGDKLFPVLEPDNLIGEPGDDYLYGGGNNDTLNGSAGVDAFDGGAGTSDVISFASATAGVSINLFAVNPGNTVNTVFTFNETSAPALFGFEGISSATIVTDPAGGTNKVAKVVKASDAGASAGTTIGYSYGVLPSDLGLTNPIDFTAASTTMTMRVYIESPQAGIRVRLKVEDQSDIGATTEADAFTTGATGWQTLTFDFANEATNGNSATRLLNLADTHDKITVFFNFGKDGASGGAGTYYFDDLKFIETPGPQGTISNDGYGNVETVQNVENVIGSANADRISGGTGANALDGGAGNDTIDGGAGNDVLTGGLGNDVLLGGDGIDKINGGDGIDTVSFTGAENGVNLTIRSGPLTTEVVTFEESTAPFFGSFGPDNADPLLVNAVIVSIANDPAGGTNKVGKFEKNEGAFSWAGTVVSTLGSGDGGNVGVLPFTANDHTMTMRVFAAIGTEVLLKLESTLSGGSVGAVATTTAAGWQTLTFDFGPALTGPGTDVLDLNIDYNKVVLFFNFGVDSLGGGGGTFYFDDLKFIGTAVSSIDNDGFGHAEGLTNVENAIGSAFADRLTGDGQNNNLAGAAGNDTLSGGGGNDSLDGGTGNDNLDGGTGTDSLVGSTGNDSYTVDSSTDMINEATTTVTEIDSVTSSATWTLGSNLEKLTLTGSTAINGTGNLLANTITGNTGANALAGSSGNDTISGGSGNDSLDGGTGNDNLDGGTGIDRLVGGTGNDTYTVDGSTDVIIETTTTATEIDSVISSATLTLGSNLEKLTLTGSTAINGTGNLLANTITGNTGANVLAGSSGNDTISGGSGNDSLDGGTGNDNLDGGTGIDRLVGGTGNDSYTVDSSTDVISETTTTATEIDSVSSSATWTLGINLEKLTLTGSTAINGTGNLLANTITGNTGANLLNGDAGNDTISGGAGNDGLNGGTGSDLLMGGTGNDSYTVDSSGDVISETSTVGTEIDSVISSATFVLGSNLEKLTLTGTSSLGGTGNSLANTITGNTGSNVLAGRAGNDTLNGGAGNDNLDGGTGNDSLVGGTGNDSYTVDSSSDLISEISTLGTEIDRVTSSATYTLGNNLETLTLTGTAAINGTGNALANTMVGNTGNNLLSGLGGNDVLTGGEGIDTFRFASAISSTTNIDTVTDFVKGEDRIQLENSFFTKFTTVGVLSAANFVASSTGLAVDSNDYVLFETDTGKLFYDADGSGAGASVLIATLSGAPALASTDIFLT